MHFSVSLFTRLRPVVGRKNINLTVPLVPGTPVRGTVLGIALVPYINNIVSAHQAKERATKPVPIQEDAQLWLSVHYLLVNTCLSIVPLRRLWVIVRR